MDGQVHIVFFDFLGGDKNRMNRTSLTKGMQSPEFNLPYRSGVEGSPSLPFPPKSVFVTSPFLIGVLDVRWEDPSSIVYNSALSVMGVNVYRSFDSPNGTYVKLNTSGPVSSLTWRDKTNEVKIVEEDCFAALNKGENSEKKWYFYTAHKNLVTEGTNAIDGATKDNVLVEVDVNGTGTWQVVYPFKVEGDSGKITLNTRRTYNAYKNIYEEAVLPNPLTGSIRVSYTYVDGLIATDFNRRLYYKVTTVAYNETTETTIETPLSEVEAKTPYQMEATDFIWKEAIRRNNWILIQAGENVKIFLRKWNGVRCTCWDPNYGQSKGIGLKKGGCPICYGTGWVGGYEGPYDVRIAPPETEKSVNLLDAGFHITYDWASWMGPEPLVSDRDVVIRSNNDRFFISRQNPQGSRGAIYQQHFSLVHVDQTDPIYQIPVNGGQLATPVAWNAYRNVKDFGMTGSGLTDASPIVTGQPTDPAGQREYGRTVTFENIMSGG